MADAFTRDYSTVDELDRKAAQYREVCRKLHQKEALVKKLWAEIKALKAKLMKGDDE